MTDKREPAAGTAEPASTTNPSDDQDVQNRREFLIGLGKWSRAVIAGAVVGAGTLLVDKPAEAGWLNRRGGGGRGWVNGRGGGGGSWVNRRGGLGGGSWVNRR